MADERKIKLDIIDKADDMARAISQGKDIMITKTSAGIAIKKMTVQKV